MVRVGTWACSTATGDVKMTKNDRGHRLPQTLDEEGYLTVELERQDGTIEVRRVHELVALTFIGPCPEGHVLVHADGDRLNNAVDNLRYVRID